MRELRLKVPLNRPFLTFPRCCNTCADVQDAYRKKGWALKDPDSVAQVFTKQFQNRSLDVILYATIDTFRFILWQN